MDRAHIKRVRHQIDMMKDIKPHPRIVKYEDVFTIALW